MIELIILDPKTGQQRVPLHDEEYILGRDPELAIPLVDKRVSRRHARVFKRDHAYWIENLGSANGVLLNGAPIGVPVQLSPGVEVTIGPFMLTASDDDATQSPSFLLEGKSGQYKNQRFVLPLGELGVGRVEGNALVLNHASISRQHSMLHVTPQGVAVEDVGSSNGTFVNDLRVSRRDLSPGDTVRFGSVELVLIAARQGPSIAFVQRIWSRLRDADRTVQIAAALGGLSVLLLAITLVVAIERHVAGPDASTSNLGLAELKYERAITAELTAARQSVANGRWDDAVRTYRDVLDRDPINVTARQGLSTAKRAKRGQLPPPPEAPPGGTKP